MRDAPAYPELPQEDLLFAELVVSQGIAVPDHVEECLAILQKLTEARANPRPRLGELLLRKGYLTLPQLQRSLHLSQVAREESPSPAADLPDSVRKASEDPANRAGKYVKTRRIGSGGMGEVWKAWDTVLRRWTALKFLKSEAAEEATRFRREAQTAARLNHPNIGSVYEVGSHEGRPFIAMQYVDGPTLQDLPRDDRRKIVRLVRDAALALQHAHDQGIVHRDLKPANLMVEGERVFVMDFGLAKETALDASLSGTGTIVGTPNYMSPEQASGRGLAIDARSDVYSLGATLYALLSGRPPFQDTNLYALLKKVNEEEPPDLRRWNPKIDPELETIVLKCLEKDPQRRYAGARELADDLTRYLNGEAILAHPPSFLYRLRKFVLRRKALIGVATAGLLLAAATAGALTFQTWRRQHSLERARPHLDLGRTLVAELDRLLMTEDWTQAQVHATAEQARRELWKALELYPNYPEALLEIARSYALEWDGDAAREYCTRTIQVSPEFATAYLERAWANLDAYETARHGSGGRIRRETPETRSMRETILSDLAAVRTWSKDRKELTLAQGMLTFTEGDFESAARQLEAYATQNPTDPRAWSWAGHAWLHVPGKDAEALRTLGQALRLRPREIDSLIHRGRIRLLRGDLDGAIQDETYALEKLPHLSTALVNRGNAHLAKGDRDRALSDYAKAIAFNPRSADAYNNRGICHADAGDFEAAIQDYDKAIEIEPEMAEAYCNRGEARTAQGHPDRAMEDLSRAIELDPKLANAYYDRAIARKLRGDFDGALEDCSQAIALQPRFAQACNNRGSLYLRKGDYDRGIQDFSQAIAADPRHAAAYANRAAAYRIKGEWDAAIADGTKAIDLDPGLPNAYATRGDARCERARVLFATGRQAEAAAEEWRAAAGDFDRAQHLGGASAPVHNRRGYVRYLRGVALASLGRLAEAVSAWDLAVTDFAQAIRLDRTLPDPYVNRADIRRFRRDFAGALEDYRTALKVAPPDWPPRAVVARRIELLQSD